VAPWTSFGRGGLRETATRAIPRSAGRDSQDASGVDVHHLGRFTLPILPVVLEDTERVDPQVSDIQSSHDPNGVAERLGEDLLGDACLELAQCAFRRPDGQNTAPAVAQGRVTKGLLRLVVLGEGVGPDEANGRARRCLGNFEETRGPGSCR
jgi:hypothetical protein